MLLTLQRRGVCYILSQLNRTETISNTIRVISRTIWYIFHMHFAHILRTFHFTFHILRYKYNMIVTYY